MSAAGGLLIRSKFWCRTVQSSQLTSSASNNDNDRMESSFCKTRTQQNTAVKRQNLAINANTWLTLRNSRTDGPKNSAFSEKFNSRNYIFCCFFSRKFYTVRCLMSNCKVVTKHQCNIWRALLWSRGRIFSGIPRVDLRHGQGHASVK